MSRSDSASSAGVRSGSRPNSASCPPAASSTLASHGSASGPGAPREIYRDPWGDLARYVGRCSETFREIQPRRTSATALRRRSPALLRAARLRRGSRRCCSAVNTSSAIARCPSPSLPRQPPGDPLLPRGEVPAQRLVRVRVTVTVTVTVRVGVGVGVGWGWGWGGLGLGCGAVPRARPPSVGRCPRGSPRVRG